jgi:prolyl-tRNA synthetase
MRLSRYFLPVLKEDPVYATVTSHKLMLRAGMIQQLTSGVYNWLPLGIKVLQNIQDVVQFNMDRAGAVEVLMPCIQPAELWKESGRYDDYGKEMLRMKDRHENEMLFGPTNEEVVTDIFRRTIKSYKELPKILYQVQWKFRDEIRPRFGVMRGREFLMKDAYSFDIDEASAKKSYDLMYKTYLGIFRDLGLVAIPVKADTGPIGGDHSHEFHVIANTGESDLYYDRKFEVLAQDPEINMDAMMSLYAAADEKHDPATCTVPKEALVHKKGIEVGHIFYFGTKYSEKMNAFVDAGSGKKHLVEMGAYGIGVSRLVAAVIESSHDERGIIWPTSIAPFKAVIINLKVSDGACDFLATRIYSSFCAQNIDVLYDDAKESAGAKFAINDLIGSPWQIIVGPKNALQDLVELKHRRTGETEVMSADAAIRKVLGNLNVA